MLTILKRGRQNLHEFKYLMAKIDAEATLGKDVRSGSRVHYKSIFFLCKGAIGIPRSTTKNGRSRRIEMITWATAIKIIGCKTAG
jgi:hypothetical protein